MCNRNNVQMTSLVCGSLHSPYYINYLIFFTLPVNHLSSLFLPPSLPLSLLPPLSLSLQLKALKPKCPTTAFAIFCNHRKDSVAKKNPRLTPKEVTAKLSERWKAKGEKDKVGGASIGVWHGCGLFLWSFYLSFLSLPLPLPLSPSPSPSSPLSLSLSPSLSLFLSLSLSFPLSLSLTSTSGQVQKAIY